MTRAAVLRAESAAYTVLLTLAAAVAIYGVLAVFHIVPAAPWSPLGLSEHGKYNPQPVAPHSPAPGLLVGGLTPAVNA